MRGIIAPPIAMPTFHSKSLSPYVSCVWLLAAPHHGDGHVSLTLSSRSTTRSSLTNDTPLALFIFQYRYYYIRKLNIWASRPSLAIYQSLPCRSCKAAPSLQHPLLQHMPRHPSQAQATAGQWAITSWIRSRKGRGRWVRAARFMSQSSETNIFRKTLLQEQEEEDPKAVLHFYRFIWVLKPSPKTGRTQRGNYFLLIKRMKGPNIDFVLHHHTKNLPTTERMTV